MTSMDHCHIMYGVVKIFDIFTFLTRCNCRSCRLVISSWFFNLFLNQFLFTEPIFRFAIRFQNQEWPAITIFGPSSWGFGATQAILKVNLKLTSADPCVWRKMAVSAVLCCILAVHGYLIKIVKIFKNKHKNLS